MVTNEYTKKYGATFIRLKNLIIFLMTMAVIMRCFDMLNDSSPRMGVVAMYISIFLVPLFAFTLGIYTKPFINKKGSFAVSIAYIGAAYILLKLIGFLLGIYVNNLSFASALTSDDQSWVLLALIVWILAAKVLHGAKPSIVITVAICLGITTKLIPVNNAIYDIILRIIKFSPFYMAGSFFNLEKIAAQTEKRWLKISAFLVSITLFLTSLILAPRIIEYQSFFIAKAITGAPVYKIFDSLAFYVLSAIFAALWFFSIPSRKFFFTGLFKRAFQVFFWYWIVIDLWLAFDMNRIFDQVWAGHSSLFFILAIAVLMIFIAIIPLPLFSNFIDRVYTGKWRLSDSGDPVFKRIKQYSFLFSELVKRDFRKKYKRTVLGMLWSVLSPLLMLLVMWLVFSQFFGRNTAHYIVYVFSGNLVYSYFRESTNEGMSSLVGNAGIFTKVRIPKYMFLFSKNISSLISFGLTLIVFFIFVAADGLPFTWKFIFLLYPIICLVIFNVGIGLILSALFVFFKDIKYLWSIFTMLLMYMSAIFYNIESYSATAQNLFLLNPIYVYIRYFRKIVIENTIPTLWFHLIAFGYAVFFFYLGFHMYKKNNTKFLYYV